MYSSATDIICSVYKDRQRAEIPCDFCFYFSVVTFFCAKPRLIRHMEFSVYNDNSLILVISFGLIINVFFIDQAAGFRGKLIALKR